MHVAICAAPRLKTNYSWHGLVEEVSQSMLWPVSPSDSASNGPVSKDDERDTCIRPLGRQVHGGRVGGVLEESPCRNPTQIDQARWIGAGADDGVPIAPHSDPARG